MGAASDTSPDAWIGAIPGLREVMPSADLLELLPSAVYICATDGRIAAFNRRAAELWGRSPTLGDSDQRFCGSYRLRLPDGTPLAHADTPMAAALRSGTPERDREVEIERPDGSRIIVLVNIEPLRDKAGRQVGAINSFLDISDRKAAERALGDSERRSRELLDALPAAIYTTDAEGRLTAYNRAATEIWGTSPPIGEAGWCRAWRLYHPDGTPMSHDERPTTQAMRQDRAILGHPAVAERPDGSRVPIHAYPTPLHDADGRPVGAVNMLVDVSEQTRMQDRLTMAKRAAGIATFERDLRTGEAYLSEDYWRLFGGEAGARPLSLKAWLSRIHRDDRARAIADVRHALTGAAYESEHRIVWPNGEVRWLLGRGRVQRGGDGRAERLVGAFVDITERRRTEEALRLRTAELEAVMANVPAVVWLAHGRNADRIFGSHYGAELLRMPLGANQSKTADPAEAPAHFRVFRDGAEVPSAELPVQRAARGQTIEGEEIEIRFADGSARALFVNAAPLLNEKGEANGAVAAAVDITERKHAEQQQRLIMAELDHRVRNTLAAVSSIVRTSVASNSAARDFAETVAGRIEALARAHGFLAGTGWQGASLRGLVTASLAPYQAGGERAVEIDGPDLVLLPSAAVSIALAIHELAVNAAKYGALSVPHGRVSVVWREEVSGGMESMRFAWIEGGGPRVVPPSRRGFGHRIIEGALRYDLGATVNLDYAPEGLRVLVALPLGRIADAEARVQAPEPEQPEGVGAATRVLVVEDNSLVAFDLAATLSAAGIEVVGPVGQLDKATAMAETARFDAALLDVNLDGVQVFPLADLLEEQAIPFAFVTGYDRTAVIPERFLDVPSLQKPASGNAVVDIVRRLLGPA